MEFKGITSCKEGLFRALEALWSALPIQEHTSGLVEVMCHEILLILTICIIQEILTFTFKDAICYKIDQSNIFHWVCKIINLCWKLQFQIMIADSFKLRIIVQQAGREREYSNQSKTYCSHLLPLSKRGSIYWLSQIKAVDVQRVKTRLLTKECPLNWWLMNPWVFTI